jgi:hypothetical protein
MDPELLQKLERLMAAGIELVPFDGITSHYVLARGGFVSLVEKRAGGFGNIGAPGIMTEKGFACLVWRGPDAVFVAKGLEQAASADQVAGLRQFGDDLKAAIHAV